MKTASKISFYLGMALIVLFVVLKSFRNYHYNQSMGHSWTKCKSSLTVEEQSRYMNEFIAGVEKEDFRGKHNAIVFKSETNSFETYYWNLKSLQFNLNRAAKLEYGSQEYYYLMKKVNTQFEQSDKSIIVIKGLYTKQHYILIWRWIGSIFFLLSCIIFVIGIGFQVEYD